MTTGTDIMGEQPIFSCKAHVFHIDPKTKRSWISASTAAVSVSFFYDSTRSLYRIISVEGTKAVINSTITPNMTFTKTSQKFGQWSDVRANTVYGLGFSSESELNKFIEKFQEVKEATRLAAAKAIANGTGAGVTPVTSANASPITARASAPAGRGVTPGDGGAPPPGSGGDAGVGGGGSGSQPLLEPPTVGGAVTTPASPAAGAPAPNAVTVVTTGGPGDSGTLKGTTSTAHSRSQSLSGVQAGESPKHQAKGGPGAGDKVSTGGSLTNTTTASATSAGAGLPPGSSLEAQLKYENDRLKLALAQSSANAKKWEVELHTLKNNNVRLTSALQESTANVEEWKRQLHSYKEENQRMKTKYLELEAAKGNADAAAELRKELASLRTRVEQLELELKAKNDEIQGLKKCQQQQNTPDPAGRAQEERIKVLQQENAELQAGLSLAQAQLETALAAQESQRRVLDTLNAQLAAQLSEMAGIHREIATALQT
ncbi:hypothetical protein R5R35_000881 [Gryllus longicercus]|uniref:WH1 domain-containing protein n=1 Tax=Gryllus longicercus TaxID=2509291 RepID=A0AAN9VZH3_9ORTH